MHLLFKINTLAVFAAAEHLYGGTSRAFEGVEASAILGGDQSLGPFSKLNISPLNSGGQRLRGRRSLKTLRYVCLHFDRKMLGIIHGCNIVSVNTETKILTSSAGFSQLIF